MDQAVLLGGEKVYVRVDFVFGKTYKFLKQVVVQADTGSLILVSCMFKLSEEFSPFWHENHFYIVDQV